MIGQRVPAFTLIETVIALAVIAIALTALLGTAAQGARSATHLRDKTFAAWVASNRLNEVSIAANAPATGERIGSAQMGQRQWYWREVVVATESPRIRRVEVTVFEQPYKVAAIARAQVPIAEIVGFVRVSRG